MQLEERRQENIWVIAWNSAMGNFSLTKSTNKQGNRLSREEVEMLMWWEVYVRLCRQIGHHPCILNLIFAQGEFANRQWVNRSEQSKEGNKFKNNLDCGSSFLHIPLVGSFYHFFPSLEAVGEALHFSLSPPHVLSHIWRALDKEKPSTQVTSGI